MYRCCSKYWICWNECKLYRWTDKEWQKKGNVKYKELCGGEIGHWYNCSIKHCFQVSRKMSKHNFFVFFCFCCHKEWIKNIFYCLLEWGSEVKVYVTQVQRLKMLSFYGEKKGLKNVVCNEVTVGRWLEEEYVFQMHIKIKCTLSFTFIVSRCTRFAPLFIPFQRLSWALFKTWLL